MAPPGNSRMRVHYRNKHASIWDIKSRTYACDRYCTGGFENHNTEDPLISIIQSVNSHAEEDCDTLSLISSMANWDDVKHTLGQSGQN